MNTNKLSALVLTLLTCVAIVAGCAPSESGSTEEEGTPTPENSSTPLPTGTNTPAPNSVCRNVAIRTGEDGDGPDATASYLSVIDGDASEQLGAAGFQTSGPFELCAQPPSGNKQAISLLNDVVIAVSLPNSNCACLRALAEGTTGTLYGGADEDPLDYSVTMNSNEGDPGSAPVLTQGPGTVAQKGDMRITFSARSLQISANAESCTIEACSDAVAAVPPVTSIFTTGTVVSEVTNSVQGGTVSVTTTGKPFTDWENLGQKGALAGGAVQREDVSSILGTNDVAVVNRIAEQ